ncbi:hypothetical protein GLOTRDRAFT_134534 [Gloeophyllum trabeum ATCC 11539]|uniref:Uncharacterized protein n=1 Tax=Gloeophyllum trabeum (strain ATCC 11539 / FP-39264 / Madison 617) TaxID=670483 RepID=S7PR38_GLOTA|nr:uncharacterized protein GLOTRDRAFT_134534 [Gloeophyllum trabeum ATCC 11539]EPQ49852.1 hypothetical protein GLOTRDRAFT_134534 [Gloeophyllum trabeum ATCC 11539]
MDDAQLETWSLQQNKFMATVFNFDSAKAAIEAEMQQVAATLKAVIGEIMGGANNPVVDHVGVAMPIASDLTSAHPTSLLVFNVPTEYLELILKQRVWAHEKITLVAWPMSDDVPFPLMLFILGGFTTTDPEAVKTIVTNTWLSEPACWQIAAIISDDLGTDEGNLITVTETFVRSLRVIRLDLHFRGGTPFHQYQICAETPVFQPTTWFTLREYLFKLKYPSSLYGCGAAVDFYSCALCHSVAHPKGLCLFPTITNWKGPSWNSASITLEPRVNSSNRGGFGGRGRGSTRGRGRGL